MKYKLIVVILMLSVLIQNTSELAFAVGIDGGNLPSSSRPNEEVVLTGIDLFRVASLSGSVTLDVNNHIVIAPNSYLDVLVSVRADSTYFNRISLNFEEFGTGTFNIIGYHTSGSSVSATPGMVVGESATIVSGGNTNYTTETLTEGSSLGQRTIDWNDNMSFFEMGIYDAVTNIASNNRYNSTSNELAGDTGVVVSNYTNVGFIIDTRGQDKTIVIDTTTFTGALREFVNITAYNSRYLAYDNYAPTDVEVMSDLGVVIDELKPVSTGDRNIYSTILDENYITSIDNSEITEGVKFYNLAYDATNPSLSLSEAVPVFLTGANSDFDSVTGTFIYAQPVTINTSQLSSINLLIESMAYAYNINGELVPVDIPSNLNLVTGVNYVTYSSNGFSYTTTVTVIDDSTLPTLVATGNTDFTVILLILTLTLVFIKYFYKGYKKV